MRTLLRQIKRELKTAKHCAVYAEELSGVWPDGIQREPKVARFAEDHGFRLRFIVMAYAPFSIKSLASARKSNLFDAFNHWAKATKVGRAPTCRDTPPRWCITCARCCLAARAASNAPQSVVTKLVDDYRSEEADAISGSMRASGFTMSSASLFSSSFASDSSSKVCWRSSADLSCPSSCAKVRTLP
jgi:hypothetical protein